MAKAPNCRKNWTSALSDEAARVDFLSLTAAGRVRSEKEKGRAEPTRAEGRAGRLEGAGGQTPQGFFGREAGEGRGIGVKT